MTIQRGRVEARIAECAGIWCIEIWKDGRCLRVVEQRGTKEQAMREALAGVEELSGLRGVA